MITQPFDIVNHLFVHIAEETLIVERIGHACEGEVVPHEYAALVAQPHELVRGVVSPAPYPYHIEVGVAAAVHEDGEVLVRRSRYEAVRRDHVRALAEDGDAVQDKAKILAVLVLPAVELESAEPHRRALFGDRLAARDQADGEEVERLDILSREFARPPKLGLRYLAAEGHALGVRGAVDILFPRGVTDGEHDFDAVGLRDRLGRDGGLGSDPALLVSLSDAQALYVSALAGLDENVAGYAARREHGTPVPPEMALRFADMIHAVQPVEVGGRAVALFHLADIPDGRSDDYLHRVAPRAQAGGYVELRRDMAVLGRGDRLAVDEHGGEGVELTADQHRPFRGEQGLVRLERARPTPIVFRHPKQFFFVGAREGIGDAPAALKLEVIAGRDDGGIFLAVREILHSPISAKVDHGTPPTHFYIKIIYYSRVDFKPYDII